MRGRWRWLGHALRAGQGRVLHDIFNWTPMGSRRVGRPIPTWMRTMRRQAEDKWRLVEDMAKEKDERRCCRR